MLAQDLNGSIDNEAQARDFQTKPVGPQSGL
jgi:hypothetical protein